LFDVKHGHKWLADAELDWFCAEYRFQRVPVLYRGPWSREVADRLVDGPETVSGKATHRREGIVIRSATERRDVKLGRVQLKHISAAHLLRKGGTEYQ
jgi:RNA ligase (TIGR02306 family)